MRDSLVHRGPDDAGLWVSPLNGLTLGSRRLAIFDLSERGHQPMRDVTNTLTVVFNGEIYNWVELRKELQRFYPFRTQTDTEVLLAAYARWGPLLVHRLNGMFAFALWDDTERRLFLARDRFGEKPLYYYHAEGSLLFASEIKAILASGLVVPQPNLSAVYRFLAYRETDASRETLFKDIKAVPPAHAMFYSPHRDACNLWNYWDLDPTAEIRHSDDQTYAERLGDLLRESVRLRLRADVPVGSCLSGGVDSSTIVALSAGAQPQLLPHTFSARFEDPGIDEGDYIQAVTEKFATPNHMVFPDPHRLVQELDSFAWHQEHPFAGASIYAQWCVMRLAKERGVTVLLDGQGGDETLAGYLVSAGAHYKDLFTNLSWFALARSAAAKVRLDGPRGLANLIVPQLSKGVQQLVYGVSEPLCLTASFAGVGYAPPTRIRSGFSSALHDELYQQLRCTMLPKLLRFADRSSMAFSREVRLPFLDHRLVEYLFAIPESQKIRGTVTKFVMRNAMRGRVPDKVLDRTDKRGFETPQAAWLSGPLRPWAESVFESNAFRERGWIDAVAARKTWRRFVAHPKSHHALLFRWLSLEVWARLFLRPASSFVPQLASAPHGRASLPASNPVLAQEF